MPAGRVNLGRVGVVLLVLRVQLFWFTQCPNIMANFDICSVLPIFSELMEVNAIVIPAGNTCR